ncbi:MAG: PLP-dependent aminotransferase family protein [Peptoniphilus sp.]|nr:PLP-dependent aminotransferase family protein [Peptoniphilus sp.]
MFTIYFNEESSKYQQIYEHIIKEIREKRLLPEERLPSRRALAEHLGVSLNTVISAYDQLLEEGYILSRPRSGYFVDRIIADELHREQREITEEIPKVQGYKYNFSHYSLSLHLAPTTVLKRLASQSIEEAVSSENLDDNGYWLLKREVQKYLQSYRGFTVPMDQIVITGGYRSSLIFLLPLLENKIFVMEEPGYTLNETIFKNTDKKLLKIPVDEYGLSLSHLEKTEASVAIITPNHQFPTGIIMGVRRRQELLNWAYEKKDRYIIEDDFDSNFKYTGQPIPSLKSLDRHDRVILSGSFSQVMGSFLRISYLVLSKTLKEELDRWELKAVQVPLISQIMLQKFLKEGYFAKHINRVQTHYRRVREEMLNVLKTYPKIKIKGGGVGLYFVLEFLREIPPKEVIKERAEEQHIFLESVDEYRSKEPYNPGEYIIGFGNIPLSEVRESVKALMSLFKLP